MRASRHIPAALCYQCASGCSFCLEVLSALYLALCVCVCVCVCVLYLLWEGEDVSMEHLECVLASVYEWLIGEYPCVISFGLNKLEA